MTALEKYVRLEAIGQWRETPARAPREVVVSFGDATLVLADLADRPLGHWALAGVEAIGTDGGATLYAMSRDGTETLAIRDADMIEAIAAVTRAHRHRDARRPRSAPAQPSAGALLALACRRGGARLRAGSDPRPGGADGPARSGRGASATRCCCS